MPIVHSTFMIADKPDVLMTAMRACGSLYVKTDSAIEFINEALVSTRDDLVAQWVRIHAPCSRPAVAHWVAQSQNPTDWERQVHLTLAVGMLQTIGLFHKQPEQRASSTVYHGMLTMVRCRVPSVASGADSARSV